ncbi:MAG: hypothetical protein ACKO23_04755, partial [Gemmataceae bacterium]
MASQIREKSVPSRNDSIINSQLVKVQQRIRLIDLSTSGFGLLTGFLAYASLMILLDRFFVLSVATRQFFFLFFLLSIGVYSFLFVIRPLRWRVNPHFAARQIERNLETTRNHVINWIDLADQNVPGVIRTAIGQRAAKDISDVDVEQAVSGRWTVWMGSLAAFFAGILAVLFLIIGPGPFSSFLQRAFSPFGKPATIATRTQVEIVKPAGGHTKLTIGSPLTVIVSVSGRVPGTNEKDAPCVYYRHDDQETYRKRYLQQDGDSNWSSSISPLDIGNGIFYKVAAGDHETPEFQVTVQAAPLISDFLATYRYRPYLDRPPLTRPSRKIEDLRGTEVELMVRTNRKLRDGRLEFTSPDGRGDLLRGDQIPDDASSLRFRMVLDRTGKYRIRFTSLEGESYVDPIHHDVVVHEDQSPEVRLIEPGKDVQVPANGHVELFGQVQD